ncbi:MAG TPA: phosphatase PAP2 family protein [Bacteroidia bacterium]|jgi:hypothetical protein|nr:phosphatase PAP2 family protein [Bacteroidia bacterium]
MNRRIQAQRTLYIFTLGLLLLVQTVFAQTIDSVQRNVDNAPRKKVYHINRLSGSIIILGGLATDYPAIGRIKDKANLTDAEISALNPSSIDVFDQWALHQSISNYMMYSSLSDEVEPPIFVLLPAMLALDKKIRKDWFDLLFMYCEGHVITFTFYNYSWFGPTFQNKYRPITYYTNLPMGDRTTGNNRNSEYSGHTASVAYTSFFVAKVYCDYHPDIGAGKYLLYTAALIPPVAMGYLRVMALAHFPSDDLTGLAIGSLVGIILPEIHKFKCPGINLGLMSIPGAAGLDVCWTLPTSTPKSFN